LKHFLDKPFLPKGKVSLVLIDSRIDAETKKQIRSRGIAYIEVPPCDALYDAISCHPDIQCHPLGGRKIVLAPNSSEALRNQLIHQDFEILLGNTTLKGNYPNNIAYNVARIGDFALHNTAYTDPLLKKQLMDQGVRLVHVNQGYTKCSVAIVNDHALITSDHGIAAAARDCGLDVLWIRPGFIELKGLNYGFIGGTCGLAGPDELAFIGDIRRHPDFLQIQEFAARHGKRITTWNSGGLYDFGSIIPLKECR
jgi:hypothetical protein